MKRGSAHKSGPYHSQQFNESRFSAARWRSNRLKNPAHVPDRGRARVGGDLAAFHRPLRKTLAVDVRIHEFVEADIQADAITKRGQRLRCGGAAEDVRNAPALVAKRSA